MSKVWLGSLVGGTPESLIPAHLLETTTVLCDYYVWASSSLASETHSRLYLGEEGNSSMPSPSLLLTPASMPQLTHPNFFHASDSTNRTPWSWMF